MVTGGPLNGSIRQVDGAMPTMIRARQVLGEPFECVRIFGEAHVIAIDTNLFATESTGRPRTFRTFAARCSVDHD